MLQRALRLIFFEFFTFYRISETTVGAIRRKDCALTDSFN